MRQWPCGTRHSNPRRSGCLGWLTPCSPLPRRAAGATRPVNLAWISFGSRLQARPQSRLACISSVSRPNLARTSPALHTSPRPPSRLHLADLAFGKVIKLCSSFVIVCKGFDVTRPGGPGTTACLGNLTVEQTLARQTHLLPLEVSRSIAFLRIWVRRRRPRNALTPRRTHRNPPPPSDDAPLASPPLCRRSAWPR